MSNLAGPPRLLVSVRNVEEALAALSGGADIIDIKEPNRGPLGRADADVIAAIASLPGVRGPGVPLSVALSEVHEARTETVTALPPATAYAKLGLAHLRDDGDWVSRWSNLRQTYDRKAARPVGWIAVIYADERQAESPRVLEIIEAASATGCVGVLVDTYVKTDGRLLDYVCPDELAGWAEIARQKKLMFAVAGRLLPEDLPQLARIPADVIAVRSAVCLAQDRRAAVSAERVASLKRAVQLMRTDAHTDCAIP